MRNVARFITTALLFGLIAGPVAAAKISLLPNAVQGIWMTDHGEGRAQCKAYLAAMQADNEDAYRQLVGAEVISANMLHSYAEYGEGNFYQPKRIEKLGKQVWRITSAVGIDGSPEGQDSGTAKFKLSLIRGKLKWDMESFDGKPVDSWDAHLYFRCSAVPNGMYAS
ncbi:MAG: hypothetical protein IPH79_14755 [Sphingomonadales bacterium]|nr:hypothetical protein [Sphingomonadales bacterium]